MNRALLLAMLGGRLATGVKRRIGRMIGNAVVALLMLISLVFLLTALGVMLGRSVGTIDALLIFAGGFFLLALIGWLAMRFSRSRRSAMPSLATTATVAAAGSAAAAPKRKRSVPASVIVVGAAMLGFLVSQYRR